MAKCGLRLGGLWQSVGIKDLERANRHRVDTDTDTSKDTDTDTSKDTDTDTEWQSVGIKDLERANRHRDPMSYNVLHISET